MRTKTEWRRARVASATTAADGVRLITFAVSGPLPAFQPGSHMNFAVTIDGRRVVRTYSCIPPQDGHLAVAVKLHPHSRGGSRFMWGLKPGDSIELTLPENRFELSWRAPHYLLIAGGIGITPIYGMAKALHKRGAPLRMAYAAQSRSAMPFLAELTALFGSQLEIFPLDEGRMLNIADEIAALSSDGEFYVCGPLGLLAAVKQAWAAAGRPVSRLRYEVFGDNGKFAEAPFQVRDANHGISVEVRADQTLLEALIAAGVPMIYDCERGECGLCAVRIVELDGEVDHRDVFLSDEEKAGNVRMCACVSRLPGGRAVIDVGFRP
jgi:vanillate O-demethylase ferredoxin subunit